MERASGEITKCLQKWNAGETEANNELVQLVYSELHRLASLYMARERNNRTLRPTALVSEAFMRLMNKREVEWRDRGHFYALAVREIQRVLVDLARIRHAQKRGGPAVHHVDLDAVAIYSDDNWHTFLELHEALERLAEKDPRQRQIIELRYFGGMTVEEVAATLGLSLRTINREWNFAKAWLHEQLVGGDGDGSEE
jgi:RNA polymerase sigma factor (TIGR02999 family)